MEPRAPLFPSLLVPIGDLYGVSSYRLAEAQMYAQDLDDLEREERALETTLRHYVEREGPTPIGKHEIKRTITAGIHRVVASSHATPTRLQRGGVAPVGSEGSRLGSGVQTTRGYHGHVEDDDEVDEEEMEEEEEEEEEEDDLEVLDDDEDEEEEEDESRRHGLGRGLFLHDDDDDDAHEDDDADPADSDSMDMSM